MDEDYERGGWIALAVGGGISLLYGIAYLIWSVISAVLSGFVGLASIGVALDSGDLASAIPSVILAIMPFIQLVVYIVVPAMALLVLFAAFRYKSYRSKGVVWLGVIVNLLIPAIGLVSSLGSCCNMGGCCTFVTGFLLGNIPTLFVGLVALITTGYAGYTLMQEDVAAKFEANATE